MKTRIYLVTIGNTKRLVRAGTKAAAVRHIANDLIKASTVDQDHLYTLASEGAKVEDASSEG